MKTLVEQSSDNVGKLGATMSSLQKSVQDVQANSGARLDTMSTQVQGLSDNLEEIKSRLGKLNQQLVDLQNSVQSLDAKISGTSPAPAAGAGNPTGSSPTSTAARPPPPTRSIPPASATSLAANTISLAPNLRTTSSFTAKPTSPPTHSSISDRASRCSASKSALSAPTPNSSHA